MVFNDNVLSDWREQALQMESNINAAVLGQERAVRLLTIAAFARGHLLLEGDVGVGKTTLLRAFSRSVGGTVERIEGTVDLMPSDLIYHTYINRDGKPRVDPGPLLRHGEALSIFFFNEINRARPQVHSLMLRVMAEKTVNAFNNEYHFPHLQVMADRNRVERDETYEIPAAARDRFLMEFSVGMPELREHRRQLMFDPRFHDVDALIESVPAAVIPYRELNDIAASIQRSVTTSPSIEEYALSLAEATRDPAAFDVSLDDVDSSTLVQSGMSPRGMSMLLRASRVHAWLNGRSELLPQDIRSVFEPCVAHRIFLSPVYEMRRSTLVPLLIREILAKVGAP